MDKSVQRISDDPPCSDITRRNSKSMSNNVKRQSNPNLVIYTTNFKVSHHDYETENNLSKLSDPNNKYGYNYVKPNSKSEDSKSSNKV